MVKADGTIAMTEDLTLANSSPSVDSSAASRGFVNAQIATGVAAVTDTTLVKRDGSRAMTGPLTLFADPTSGLQAATKQYVDGRNSFTPVQQGGGANQGTNKVYAGWLGATLGLQVDSTDFGSTWPISISGNAATATSAVSAQTAQTAVNGVPAGCIMAWPNSTPPSGWLECNGQSTAGYSALAAVVGSTVPDLRGQFIRGWSNGSSVDSGRALNSSQTAYAGSNKFQISQDDGDAQGGSFRSIYRLAINDNWLDATFGPFGPINVDTNAGDTRPVNKALMYIIKT
jgi:hypothetical protein